MNAFVNSIKEKRNLSLTENSGLTYDSSGKKVVDLFFKIGAMRGQPKEKVIAAFEAAFGENPELAVRVLLWSRDVREGAGERQIFRNILVYLENTHSEVVEAILPFVPVLGRWDDLLVLQTPAFKKVVYELISYVLLQEKNGLCAKWMPRKGKVAIELRNFMGISPKQYRKMLVELTNVVETKMCAKNWSEIDYSHVPSLAFSRYNKAFLKNDFERFKEFGIKAVKGEVKVNASTAVYPYDVLKPLMKIYYAYSSYNDLDLNSIKAQWNNLTNFVGDASILPMVDVSGSMVSLIPKTNLTCYDVAISLGLYLADKNKGSFKDTYLTFSSKPELIYLPGNIVTKIETMFKTNVGYSTDIQAAFRKILETALLNKVPQEDMPEYLLVISDMEFNQSFVGGFTVTTADAVRIMFENAGYKMPKLVFWNIQARSEKNIPVAYNEAGVALVSGFSPAIVKNILKAKNFNPFDIMIETIGKDRYDFIGK